MLVGALVRDVVQLKVGLAGRAARSGSQAVQTRVAAVCPFAGAADPSPSGRVSAQW